VDQIREQGDAAAGQKHAKLTYGGQGEDGERERDCVDAVPRSLDALVYQAMGVGVLAMVVALLVVSVRVIARPAESLRSPEARPDMAMGSAVGVAVHPAAVPVGVLIGPFRGV